MSFIIGVNVVEVDGGATPAVEAAPSSIAGLVIRAERGVPNRATRIRGLVDFSRNFGGYRQDLLGAHVVKGFFDNGGADAFVTRVVGANALVAEQVLDDRAAAPTLRVRGGVGGQEDPGRWADDLAISIEDHPSLSVDIPAQIAGDEAEPFALANGQTLVVTVNGSATPVTVTFAAADFTAIGAATAAEVIAAIARVTTEFRAIATAGSLTLVNNTAGPASHLEVAGTGAAALGFDAPNDTSDGALPAATTRSALPSVGGIQTGSAVRLETRGHIIAPNDVQPSTADGASIIVTVDGGAPQPIEFVETDFVGGVAAITAGEVVAAINRQAQGFFASLTHEGRLVLLSNSFGPGSTIAVAAGPTDATTDIGLNGAVAAAGASQARVLDSVAEADRVVEWTGGIAALPVGAARFQSAEFDLVVHRAGQEVERFPSLSMQAALPSYAPDVVNEPASGSRFIVIADLASPSGPALNVPAVVSESPMTTLGDDGDPPTDLAYLGSPVERTGLHSFDLVSVQLIACPETTSPAVAAGALTYCANRGDAMLVGAVPPGLDLVGMAAYAAPLRGRKVFGALYGPWISIVNPLDVTGDAPRIFVPPTGHVLGAYARIAEARGPWKAPAGDEAVLRNALGVEFDMTDVDHTDLVKNGSVNGIRAVPGAGVIIDASRTLSTDSRWLFVNVRRLFNFVKTSLRDSLRWVPQEPHTAELRRAVKFNVIQPFLLGLWRQGAFGSGAAKDAFTVICDETNNPPAEVQLGNFRAEVYFYPSKPAETIVVIVGQQEAGGSASEA
jgi:phage tail sheath protein FI